MAPIEHEPLGIVLGSYNFEVLDIKNESYKEKKAVWWIRTNRGTFILKKHSCSKQTLLFMLDAIRHLTSNGVHIPGIVPTSEGRKYVYAGNACYVLTEAIEGRNPSYAVPAELDAVVEGLARFHRASAGFSPSPGTKPKYHLGLWIEEYSAKLEDIKSIIERIARENPADPINSVILREFPHFCERASKAIELLKGEEYARWVHEAERTGCLCHQDFAAGNLIMAPGGDLYVLDTDSITMDIAARDIRKLLNKVMKKLGKWDAKTAARMLERYQAINPLSPPKWEVVRFDLMFPHLFIGTVDKYFYRRDSEWTDEKYKRRIIEMSAFEKTAEPVLESFGSIAPSKAF